MKYLFKTATFAAASLCVAMPLSLPACAQNNSPASASAPVKPVPPGGVPVLGDDATAKLAYQGGAEFGKVETVSVAGQPFKTALRLTTLKRPVNEWDIQAVATSPLAAKPGDVMLASFYVRAIKGQPETGEARTTFIFETGAPGFEKSVEQGVGIGKEWRLVQAPFVVRYPSEAGTARVAFRMGYTPQVWEIGGFELLNFGDRVKVADLPRSRSDYAGQEADAPWRKAALARIEKIRKGDMTVEVRGRNGKPIRGAQVTVEMTRHQFKFGSAVAPDFVNGTGPDNDRYRDTIKANYNAVVIENHLKWPDWDSYARPDALKALDWLNSNQIQVRAHNIIWPSWQYTPADVKTLANDKPALTRRISAHIADITAATRGKVYEWDVVNEPFAQHDILDILGRDVMADWFRQTRQGDPNARLTLNDYPPLDGAALDNSHLNDFYNNIARLKQLGAPIGGIGFQCHFGSSVIPPARIVSGLDRFARFGLPIAITEFDMNTQDTDLQARYMRDFMTAAFSHPSVDSIIMWGFWEGRHWLPDAALYRQDWSLKPHGQVWLDLVKRDWHTRARAATDRAGRIKTRAFYGTYAVDVTTPDGKTARTTVNFDKPGKPIVVTAP